jgi:hypothetical protein
MRKQLAKQAGERKLFQATFERLGKKTGYTGYSEDTILLKDVVDSLTGEKVCDHVWFSYTKGFEKIKLIAGVKISFQARVKQYRKGYVNPKLGLTKRSTDFKLSHPTAIKIVSVAE